MSSAIGRGDRGTTLLEISVVASIMAIVTLALLSVLDSTATVERGLDARVEAQENLRAALAAVASDVRAGTPAVGRLAGGPDLAVAVETDDGLGNRWVVHWTITASGLERVVVDAESGREIARDLRFAGLASTTDPTFRYYDAAGSLLDADTLGPRRLADCTSRIRISLAFEAGTSVRDGQLDVAVRARTPGANAC